MKVMLMLMIRRMLALMYMRVMMIAMMVITCSISRL